MTRNYMRTNLKNGPSEGQGFSLLRRAVGRAERSTRLLALAFGVPTARYLVTGLAVVLLLASPVMLSAQTASAASAAPASGACGFTVGNVIFTGLPKGDGPPSDLLSFKTASGKNASGAIVPGSYWLCKEVDENSVGLMIASLLGTKITSIHLEILNPNPTTTSLVFDFKDALVSSVALTSNSDRPREEIEFTSCDVEITINHPDGGPDKVLQHCGPPTT